MTSRRPSHIPARKPFPRSVKAAVLQRSGGMCEADGCSQVGKEFDHIKAVAIGGLSTLENCRLLCTEHNAEFGIQQARAAAKADRAGGRSGQKARRDRAKANGTHRKIQSAPLQKGPNVSRLNSKHPSYQSRGFGKREER